MLLLLLLLLLLLNKGCLLVKSSMLTPFEAIFCPKFGWVTWPVNMQLCQVQRRPVERGHRWPHIWNYAQGPARGKIGSAETEYTWCVEFGTAAVAATISTPLHAPLVDYLLCPPMNPRTTLWYTMVCLIFMLINKAVAVSPVLWPTAAITVYSWRSICLFNVQLPQS